MKKGGRKNFGYGNMVSYAVRQALLDRYGPGKFGTRHSHAERLRFFERFLGVRGIRDLTMVDRDMVLSYGELLRSEIADGNLATSTAQNRLSSLNVVMEFLRGDKKLSVSPAEIVGRRTAVRQRAPEGLAIESIQSLVRSLDQSGQWRVSALVGLCRFLGLRLKEASLLYISGARRQAIDMGHVLVSRGTKGGRGKSKPRSVPANPNAIAVLETCSAYVRKGRNVVPAGCSWVQWCNFAHRKYAKHAGPVGITKGPHELRSSYACTRYLELTGFDAPVVAGILLADRRADRAARLQISKELGHSRASVAAAYIGGLK